MLFYKNFAKKSLRRSGFKEPVQMTAIMLLFVLGVVTFPTRSIVGFFYKGGEEFVFLFAEGVQRIAFTFMMLHFAKSLGFKLIPRKTHVFGIFATLLAFVIAVNNFPFVSYITGQVGVEENSVQLLSFMLWCVGVGLFEEVSVRGIIFPLVLIKLSGEKAPKLFKKRPVFWSIAISSVIFSLLHLVNLLNGNVGGTFMQVGYTFLIGAMCCIVTAVTGDVLVSACIHTVYNVCGMMIESCGFVVRGGRYWSTGQIICTAAVGAVVCVIMIIIALRADKDPSVATYMLGDAAIPEPDEGATNTKEG